MRLDELGLEDIQSIPHGHRVEPRELRKLTDGQRGAGDLPVRRAALNCNLAHQVRLSALRSRLLTETDLFSTDIRFKIHSEYSATLGGRR